MPCNGTIRRVLPKQVAALEAETKEPLDNGDLHELLHEVFGEFFPNQDHHELLESGKLEKATLERVWNVVRKRYLARRKRKLGAANYLEQEGRHDDAEKLRDEVKREDEEIAEEEAEVTA